MVRATKQRPNYLMRAVQTIVGIVFIMGLVGCDPELPPAGGSFLGPDGNFVLYVTNQSYALDRVDIRVEIDGELVVSDYFEVGSQHNFVKFKLSLTKGKHSIHAWSEKGEVELSTDFEFTDEHGGTVMFWHNPDSVASPNRYIHYTIEKEPLRIM
jgi:hypothetical protein